ncbi:MAG: urate hydroxylase PuuD, partial [Candidatus Eremiobacteraeota bacterium]|nr:urate hydroxylase PuuD [Candidatus Eremiobacteraeota bacterium]
TLPVLFIMISNHYPMTYSTAYGWLVLAAIGLAGVLVRHFFILTHKGRRVLALPIAAGMVLAAAAIAIAPRGGSTQPAVAFAVVGPVFAQRCAACHSAHPTQPGFANAPAGVLLDTPAHIAANAPRIYLQAVSTTAMPLGNITGMTPRERALVGAWIAGGAGIR